MTEEDTFKIAIGKNPADNKWYAICTLPSGRVLSTKAHDSHDECRETVEQFLLSKGIKYDWHRTQ